MRPQDAANIDSRIACVASRAEGKEPDGKGKPRSRTMFGFAVWISGLHCGHAIVPAAYRIKAVIVANRTPEFSRSTPLPRGDLVGRRTENSLDREINSLDEHDLSALILHHVVAVHAVAPGVELVRTFEALVALDGEDRLAEGLGLGAIRVVHG
jgi:hypothetical protein